MDSNQKLGRLLSKEKKEIIQPKTPQEQKESKPLKLTSHYWTLCIFVLKPYYFLLSLSYYTMYRVTSSLIRYVFWSYSMHIHKFINLSLNLFFYLLWAGLMLQDDWYHLFSPFFFNNLSILVFQTRIRIKRLNFDFWALLFLALLLFQKDYYHFFPFISFIIYPF